MQIKHKLNFKPWVYVALPFLLAATIARAADTDVYFNSTNPVLPNVMFSIDTSGSMGWDIMTATPDYSPTTNYLGTFDDSKIYISTDGRIPAGTSGISSAPLQSAAHCDFAVSPLAVDGFTGIRAAVAFSTTADTTYPKNIWIPANKVAFDTNTAADVTIECSDDSGTHGAAPGSGPVYAGSTTTYTNTAADEIDWEKFPFVALYTGRYLNYKANPPASITVDGDFIQKRVIADVIKRSPDIVAGLTRLYNSGGVVIRGLRDNSIRANQQNLLATLAATGPGGGTPLAGSMLELLHYFHGLPKFKDFHWSSAPDTDPTILSGGNYVNPIISECQKNYVVMVTDGQPWGDTAADPHFVSSNSDYPNYATHTGQTSCSGNCLDEMTGYMSKQDASPLPNAYDLDGDSIPDPQTVKVYPIGMEIQQDLLDDAATTAGTKSYYAQDALEFENAFIEILASIKESGGVSMITASSSNNRFSKTANRDFLYYGQFVPSTKFQWQGNLKKYRYAYTNDGVTYITDTSATDPDITQANGSFISTAKSYWSSAADGNNALEGGVLDRLKSRGATGRLIKGINVLDGTEPDDTNVPIMTTENDLSTTNAFYAAQVGNTDRSAAELTAIRNYAIGQDVHDQDNDSNTTEQRPAMGGIIRSAPVAVQYGGTEADPDIVIFATTTDGMLHAFDDETGDELWAVLMPEAYPYLAQQHDNNFSDTPWWGIDGSLAVRVKDVNENGIIESGDKVFLYISGGLSMRRWFMVDVTNATQTSNQATLVYRGKHDATDTSWDELGMAISPMVPVTYQLSTGNVDHGVIYANGWDPTAEFSYAPSTMGRGLSMYDAETGGAPLWQMTKTQGGAGMDYSFATQPTTVDMDGDGLTDLIYAIDVNAQIWRFNVKNGATTTGNLISGGKLATLGNDSDGNRRRAYRRIDASVINTGSESQVLLAVGTGDRMNPLSVTDNDRIYVIRDTTAASGANPTSVLTHSDFYDATANTIGEGSDTAKLQAQADLNAKNGWYIQLPAGAEKSISAPLISSGIVNFPVYKVGGASVNPCDTSNAGSGVLYRLNVLDATPVSDYSGDTSLTTADRFVSVRGGGIPGDAVLHTSSTGIKSIVVGKDLFIDRPNEMDPTVNATPDESLQGDAAGYWFEEKTN